MISVICSNFNGARFLPRLLASLRAQRGVELELIVVDRHSTDGSDRILAAEKDVRVLSEPPERGLVAGYAAGVPHARGEFYFFCNEDMWFEPDCLARLLERIDLGAKVGAADGWHWTYDGSEWLHGCTRFHAARWAINSPHPRRAAHFQVPLPEGSFTPFPCAGAFLIHRDMYRESGGWDTDFFLDHEDIDLFLRAWQRGWKCASVPGARVHHALNASNNQTLTAIGQSVSRRRYVGQRANMVVIALKYFGWPALALAALQWPVAFANNLLSGRWRHVAGDFTVLGELRRRGPKAWEFRRANKSYNHYFPGEAFFRVPEYTDESPVPSPAVVGPAAGLG